MPTFTVQQAFALALQQHQAGQLIAAEALYRQLLAAEPRHADALHLLGVIAHQTGRNEVAVDLIQQAIVLAPTVPEYFSNLGEAYRAEGKFDEAIAACRQAIARKPDYPEAYGNLGAALYARGQLDEAIVASRQAIALKPGFAEAFGNLGGALYDKGQLDEAIAACRQAVALKPNYPDAYANLTAALYDKGQLDEAITACRQAIAVAPDCPEAYGNLSAALYDKGQLDEAIAACRQAIALKPNYPAAHSNLGNMLRDKGESDDSIAACRKAIALEPNSSEAHNNLGNALRDKGQLNDAIAAYRQAISLKPNHPKALNNLGSALSCKGDLDEAIASVREAIALKPDYPEAHCNLGHALRLRGMLDESVASFERAIELSPTLVAAHAGLCSAMSALVPQWHVPMMNDRLRNDFYFAALQAVVMPESSVLEIGTGSGLLAMMAARLGAREVTTCEAVPLVAGAARRIISENGFEQRIRVVSKKSTEAIAGVDLPAGADILVSEIFSSELLGEGVLTSIEDAKRRLLKPDCRIVPSAASIMIALFGGEDIGSNLLVGDSCGFDLRHFNSIIARKQFVYRNDLPIELLTEGVEAFRFDFAQDSFFPSEGKTLRLPITAPGRCLGIIQWIRLEMGNELTFENHPVVKTPASSWQSCVHVFAAPLHLEANEVAVVSAFHDRLAPWFSLHGTEKPSRLS